MVLIDLSPREIKLIIVEIADRLNIGNACSEDGVWSYSDEDWKSLYDLKCKLKNKL